MKAVNKRLERGAAIDVAFYTHDNTIWHSAMITYIDCDIIKAVTASGHQFTVDRRGNGYRVPQAKRYG